MNSTENEFAGVTGLSAIADGRNHEGPATFRGKNPATGEALEPAYGEASAADVARATSLAAMPRSMPSVKPAWRRAPRSWRPSPPKSWRSAMNSSSAPWPKPACRAGGLRASAAAPSASCVCSPPSCAKAQLARCAHRSGPAGAQADAALGSAPAQYRDRAGCGVRRQQFPAGLLGRGRRYRLGPGRGLPGGGQGPSGASGHRPRWSAAPSRRRSIACGLPEGVFSLLFGAGNALGGALVADPRSRRWALPARARAAWRWCRSRAQRAEPIPVYAEMSSINPVILLPGALAARGRRSAKGFVGSLTLGAGQFCTNPGLVLALDGPELETVHRRRRGGPGGGTGRDHADAAASTRPMSAACSIWPSHARCQRGRARPGG